MYYYKIYLRGVKGIFTWEHKELINEGDRVEVKLRGKLKIGIVTAISKTKPSFKTQPILSVLPDFSLGRPSPKRAKYIAESTFSPLEKVYSLMIPEAFMMMADPTKCEFFYTLLCPEFEARGLGQKKVLAFFLEEKKVSHKILREVVSQAIIKNLLDKKVIKLEKGCLESRYKDLGTVSLKKLTEEQKNAVDFIEKNTSPSLLWGVTGSGKTEVYKTLIAKILKEKKGSQVLFLVPEIGLTPQLITDFQSVFGNQISVWHSALNAGEKVQEWARMSKGEARILIGTRSALLVPIPNLAMVITDEEHEWTYKNEFAPRFMTHDILDFLYNKENIKLVFGSATPRIESFQKVKEDYWGLVKMEKRINDLPLPEIQIVDLKNETKKGNYGPLSEPLKRDIEANINNNKQVVLFLNKRGFSGSTLCKTCGHEFHCPHCDNFLKKHGREGINAKFICHLCGHLELLPKVCPECKEKNFDFRGWGTEQVEYVLSKVFPKLRVMRADKDTITGRYDFEKMLQAFEAGEADILLGTQMVAKGLDFSRVGLVGIIMADVGLKLPDFRAEERIFQLLTQVSGRAGRRDGDGKIIIQTFDPEHKVFDFVRRYDTAGFIDYERDIRQSMGFPPFSFMAKIIVTDRDKTKAFVAVQKYYKVLKAQEFKGDIFCSPAFFPRIGGKYFFHIILKSETKEGLYTLLKSVEQPEEARIDMSPISLL